ncbi:MEKHLA domain-containing protein [Lysobacter sp. K5869]|uniref:MEKHLA domain-containing protein n=1 Tax=Lysobacter sp. K5869 TaxID=2820808 RepID=UPI001C060025|nr:MEKHLA domain-containing protein [Lysobacter sp. K5869]QWP76218.1 MEKHLA domain-containing protein [Lysobacter sp. K5869]
MPDSIEIAAAHALIDSSYRHWFGRSFAGDADASDWLYREAPFALLAHGNQDDPEFIYANAAAQRLFEYTWDQIVGLPSRLSAPADQRPARVALLQRVERDGFARDYEGLRVSRSGRRFWIERVTVWQLRDAAGCPAGLAALIPSWRPD